MAYYILLRLLHYLDGSQIGSGGPLPARRTLLLQQRNAVPDVFLIRRAVEGLEHVTEAILVDQTAV